jgi:hypothetical protein
MHKIDGLDWRSSLDISRFKYECGYCGSTTAPSRGYYTSVHEPSNLQGYIFLCSNCNRPSYAIVHSPNYAIVEITPETKFGKDIIGLPTKIQSLYDEARLSTSVGAYTSAVLTCRKLLMHIAAEKGAATGLSFFAYINYLAENNYIPKGGLSWVDYIRTKSNEANHEINIMGKNDAEDLIDFTEMLLRIIYEFESRLPTTPSETE